MTGEATRGRAGLGMYPFEALRPAFDRLWAAVSDRVAWVPESLEWDTDLHEQWRDPNLVVGYTCGWPLVTQLLKVPEAQRVQVLGTFVPHVPEAEGPTYHSVLVARRSAVPTDFIGAIAAVNNDDSLSGWVSLVTAVEGRNGTWTGSLHWTGAHLESIRAVHFGSAEIASIDAVSLAHVRRLHPGLFDNLVEVGHGPRVPCLPLIAGPGVTGEQLAELQAAFADAVADPALADVRSSLLIDAFVPRTLEDYLPLLALAPH